ncbi:MAG: hypothetical protein JWM28_315 [Chitinophagaceae bacterium]|nr:hypothetical protein [Chitinophagaceae bacterium]
MKVIINISRVLVGTLFIFSGLVKANDPMGLSYKMQEFFEIWNEGLARSSFFLNNILINLFQFLHDHSLPLSVIMIAFEIIAGVALLLGWRMKLFSWLLLLLIVFFTFLTGYAFLSGKFKNCGCFGDCLPITPLTSFLKDVVLTILIFFLFYHRKKIKPLFSNKPGNLFMLTTTILSFGIQWYALNYLPVKDCLPFKVGNNIKEQMKIPPGALPDSFAIRFVYEKGGKPFEFSPTDLPADLGTYTFKERVDKLIRKGNAEAPVKGFSLSGVSNEDSTNIVLAEPYCLLLFDENFSTPVAAWKDDFSKIYLEAKKKNVPVYIITTSPDEALVKLAPTSFHTIPVFKCDYTVIRTAARTNPTLYLLKEGTIVGKWSYKRMSDAFSDLNKIPVLPAQTNDMVAPDSSHIKDSTNH